MAGPGGLERNFWPGLKGFRPFRSLEAVVEFSREKEMSAQAIQGRIQVLKDLASQLSATIVDEEARDHFLRPIWSSLTDAEYTLSQELKAPNPTRASLWFEGTGLFLRNAEVQLKGAQGMVSKYGPNLRVVGGG